MAAAAAAAAALCRLRNSAVHGTSHLPAMSLLLSLDPGSGFDISLGSCSSRTFSRPCAPRPLEAGKSALSRTLPILGTTRVKAPFHQGFGCTRFYNTHTRGSPERAVFSQMGYDLDPNDKSIRFDAHMKKNPPFELVVGHELISDSVMAVMWDRKAQKVLENMLWLDHVNSLHGVSIAASFVPENILVAENSSSIQLINPVGHRIDGIDCFTSDGLKAAVTLYFTEAKKNQPSIIVPLDVAALRDKIENLTRIMMTEDQAEEYLYDASFLDDPGLTAALHQANFLLRGSYNTSNHPDDIMARDRTLTELQKLLCRDGTSWKAYLNSNSLLITDHFYQETLKRSAPYRLIIARVPLPKRHILNDIQDGHDQLGAQRNTGVHINDWKNIGLLQRVINPQPQQIINPSQQQVIVPPQQQVIVPPQQKVIMPPQQHAVSPQQRHASSPQQQHASSPQQQHASNPQMHTVSSNAVSKYHRCHFPLTTGTIFDNMRQGTKSKKDMNIPSFFVSDRKPRT